MKTSDWIHARERLREYSSVADDEADPRMLLATLRAVIDYLELYCPPPGPLGPDMRPLPAGANGPARAPGPMTIHGLRDCARTIWGPPELSLQDIVIRLGVDYGKLARLARGATKDPTSREDLEAAFGNVIFSMIRWADDLGLDPVACVTRAITVQLKFVAENPNQ